MSSHDFERINRYSELVRKMDVMAQKYIIMNNKLTDQFYKMINDERQLDKHIKSKFERIKTKVNNVLNYPTKYSEEIQKIGNKLLNLIMIYEQFFKNRLYIKNDNYKQIIKTYNDEFIPLL